MREWIVGTFLLALVGAVYPAAASGPRAVTHIWFDSPPEITQGGKLISEGKIEEGMALIRKVMHVGLPMKFQARGYTNLCGGYLKMKEYSKAIRQCRRAIKMDSSIWQALSNRGAARFALGRYSDASEDFRRAIELDPENAALKENLALAEEGERSIRKH